MCATRRCWRRWRSSLHDQIVMTVSDVVERIKVRAERRGVRFSRCLPEKVVADFESANGIGLPPDYRQFLLNVGNGGDGPPTFGLCSLGAIPPDFDFGLPDLAKPFPFTRAWVWESGTISTEGAWSDANCGVLILGTDGCGLYWALVVRGPDFGSIWMLSDVGITPTIPKMTFTEWYEAWLDGTSKGSSCHA